MTATDLARRARQARHRLRERAGLRERVRVLEAEVQESRQLNRRIAELTDVVTELLIPLESRDQGRVDDVLARFRAGL
ncbi:DUF6752 domain-containing protein [Nocardioides sp. SLBN-35]|uniref:DUF6752 domain-containing protein n=1 Tax=Nocardioides sp. SLBN-35 TaxID=2768445 RepID=UPI00114D8CD8|nr:DUF6752 domain-containing protein [Nocardioides sp. SLBN-35]TQK71888.1 hypothetical protein FBY23_3693 [Nocardioides sp. SLBN-35]